jgi:protein arginine kinase activator
MEFKAEGRLACPHDCQVFHTALEPLLQRIHRSTRHAGKKPQHRSRSAGLQTEIMTLRRRLREAVDTEHYEEAARLRDQLRQKEARDEPG